MKNGFIQVALVIVALCVSTFSVAEEEKRGRPANFVQPILEFGSLDGRGSNRDGSLKRIGFTLNDFARSS